MRQWWLEKPNDIEKQRASQPERPKRISELAIQISAHPEPNCKPSRVTGFRVWLAALCEGGHVLTDGQAFQWRQRLLKERSLRNITDMHVRILLFTQGAIEAGDDQMSHAAVAEALDVAVRTVGDAYRRAKGVGLLEWDPQFRVAGGVRRRIVNCYRLVMPLAEAEARPDLRRHRKPPLVLKLPTCSAHSAERPTGPLPGFMARFAAKLAEERRIRAARR